jgi:hypothetical protein
MDLSMSSERPKAIISRRIPPHQQTMNPHPERIILAPILTKHI